MKKPLLPEGKSILPAIFCMTQKFKTPLGERRLASAVFSSG